MPSLDRFAEPSKKGKVIRSAYDSESFESDITIHVDGLVGSATISPSGRDIALASPDGLAIIDLDSPYNPPRRLRSYGLPWLVTDVQWSPFAARDYWIVSTANHCALVWNLNQREDSTNGAIEHSLQGHTRAITDINFSAHHPDLLSTCSVDGSVHSWDLRRPRQPVLTYCDWFAGATQVKYSRQDPHVIASSHDRWLHVWDDRRTSEPLKSINAHKTKIYGLDWNRVKPTALSTCSLDKTIKFWDYSKEVNEPDHVIHTEFPVWRARHTPFGWGMLAMPQNEPGDLYLYDRKRLDETPTGEVTKPVHIFPGHAPQKAKEFLWRTRGGISEDRTDNREFQLVSWGTDNELRLQCLDPEVLSDVGYVKGGRAPKAITLTRKGAAYKTFRNVDDDSARDRRTGTMSDPRAAFALQHQSALTMSMRSGPQGQHSKSSWRGPSMKATVKGERDNTQSQISWLKGITITRRKETTNMPKRQMSKDSSIFGHGYPDDDWGEPDTVQDELLRISTQIPKIRWENIDMDTLTLNASLNGPWGESGDAIFIKVKIDIPEDYPTSSAPSFLIEKTSFLPEETHARLTKEIHELAHRFLLRKKNCLEKAFTYLLGEADLESSTFFKNVGFDDDITGLEDESSSSEEEEADIPTGGSASMSQELVPPTEIENSFTPINRSIIPPPPRTCGARFSNDCRLVCFFPTKEEKARVLFSNTTEVSKERPKGEPFAGFGRLTFDAAPRQRYNGDETSAADDHSDTEDSDESSSSSDSGSTSMHKLSLWYHPRRVLRKTWSENRSIRSSGGGTGTGIGTATGTVNSRRRIGRPRNVVSLHDVSSILPSKKEFAQGYAIFGDGADVCSHNALLADKYGHTDIADIWRYLALLLRTGIPLEVLTQKNNKENSILVIAHDIVSQSDKTSNWVHLGDKSCANSSHLSGRVKWGHHPLARDFIADLFYYFEKIADIQMLAMLSCIFSDSSADECVAYAESQLPQPETPLALKTPSFSLEYFPTDAAAWNLSSRNEKGSAANTPRTPQTPGYARSHVSEEAVWGEELVPNSYSYGDTPPSQSRLADLELPLYISRTNSRSGTRANTSLASSFTATTVPKMLTGDNTPSPPNQSKKKLSPAEAILNTLAPGMSNAWANSALAGDSGVYRASLSDDEYHTEDTLSLVHVPVSVAVFVENQTIFDDDGWLSTPLLEPSRASLYANYRHAYAEMLQMWNEPLARLEIMKFNNMKDAGISPNREHHFPDSFSIPEGSNLGHPRTGSSPIVMGKRDHLQALVASNRGLDITGMCRLHETQLEPLRYSSSYLHTGGAVGTCDRCRSTQSQLRCVYCLEPVDALFPPCLSCGCASHEHCLAEWHAAGETVCPAGDECNCVEEASNGQVESWAALQAAMLKTQSQVQVIPPVVAPEEDRGGEVRGRQGSAPPDVSFAGDVGGLMPSAASLGLGRLKKSTGSWSRASSLRRNKRQEG
ncbi:hypothetical protein V2G26_017002 [Clonostachys chloroleuca]